MTVPFQIAFMPFLLCPAAAGAPPPSRDSNADRAVVHPIAWNLTGFRQGMPGFGRETAGARLPGGAQRRNVDSQHGAR
ncbi:hypothetical protein GCM10022282_30160 [Agromyces indicus]